MTSADTGSDRAVMRARRLLCWLESQLTHRSIYVVGIVVTGISLLKSGVTGTEADIWSLDSWPNPVDMYPPLTYGTRGIGWILGVETNTGYAVIGACLLVATASLICFLAARRCNSEVGVWVVVVLLSGPSLWILSGRLVHTDAFVVMGAAIVAFAGGQLRWAAIGAVVASLGSPEQAVITFACLSLLTFVPRYRNQLQGALLATGLSLMTLISLTAWANSLGVGTRSSVFLELIRRSVEIFLTQLPLTLYSGFGISIVVIAYAALKERVTHSLVVLVASIAVPLLATALTTDQSRVLVIASSAPVIFLVVRNGAEIVALLRRWMTFPIAVTFLVVTGLPAIEVTGWVIRIPWTNYFSYLQTYVIDGLPL